MGIDYGKSAAEADYEDLRDQDPTLREIANPVAKLLQYKFGYDKTNKGFDVDVSLNSMKRAQSCYQYLKGSELVPQRWYNDYQWKYELHDDAGFSWRGDTMNSFFTTFSRAVAELTPNTIGSKPWREGDGERVDELVKQQYGLSPELWQLFSEFARINHTAGNVLPLPWKAGFEGSLNTKRFDRTADYSDLLLYAVYLYYQGEPVSLDTMYGEVAPLAKVWLDHFGGWTSFVEQNYLQSALAADGSPRELFKGHFLRFIDNLTLPEPTNANNLRRLSVEKLCPQNEVEYGEYLRNVIAIISERNAAIRAVLTKD